MINNSLKKIDNNFCFANATKIVNNYKENNIDKKVLSLSIGDVSCPIIKPVIDAMHKAVDDLSKMDTFKGYGASNGYDFLKKAILNNDYKDFNFSFDEIYISNGTKSDVTNILELFDINAKILITNPLYPIYKDGSKCLNRNVYNLDIDAFNDLPVPKEKYDIIYICSPNNPLGIAYNYDILEQLIKYANKNHSVILYDNVYEAFISSPNVPHSIYEIDGAKKCAIEFRSFSKKASFTGVRCSYYIIPNEIDENINHIWKLRNINRFNGADYIAQRGAEATFLPKAKKLISKNINYYKENALIVRRNLISLGFEVYGGIDSPYIWVKIKEKISSWDLFIKYLNDIQVVVVPGIIFGSKGDNYFRISALGKREDIILALERLKKYYEK